MGAGGAGTGSGRSMPGGSAERVGAGGGAPAPIPPGMGVRREGIANSLAPGPNVVLAADTVLAAAASSRPALPAAPLPRCGRAGRGPGGGARRRFSPPLPCPARLLAPSQPSSGKLSGGSGRTKETARSPYHCSRIPAWSLAVASRETQGQDVIGSGFPLRQQGRRGILRDAKGEGGPASILPLKC